MKVSELIEYLKDLPADTKIKIYKDIDPLSIESKYRMAELDENDLDFLKSVNILHIG